MAIDAYVKFGESKDLSPLYLTPLPQIEGDSDDSEHHWWCEMRDCGFELETPEHDASKDSESKDAAKEAKSGFKPVKLKKRVDWGTTQLFIKCCESAEATTKKSDDKDGKGLIEQVTVHVCRPGGERKIPFVIVRYYGVRVTNFKIGMAGPESSEEITFEFEELEYEFVRTDPFTGAEVLSGSGPPTRLKNHPPKEPAPGEGGSGDSSGNGAAGGAGPAAAVLAAVAGPSGGSGSLPGIATALDLLLNANYPGASAPNVPAVQQN